MTSSRPWWMVALLALLLMACSPSDDSASKAEANESQAHYFLESLKLVEQAGRQLQSEGPTQILLEHALSGMDAGMALAFKVDAVFLNQLDVRLGKNYQRYFIEGVQTYRLGIEAADQDEQQKGLMLLSRWAQFWGGSQTVILQKLAIETKKQ
jgi:hypothetical protein